MKVALVTTPPSLRSGIGDYTRHLLPYLREHCDVDVYVSHGLDDEGWKGEEARLIGSLDPRQYDQVLYQLGNELAHAFMPAMIRSFGGTVMQHDWVLFDMALAAWPGLVRGGAKGHALAIREGGLMQTHLYLRNWLDKRRQRSEPEAPLEMKGLPGTLLFGWHSVEEHARWTADHAGLRIPGEGVEWVRFELHLEPGRTVRILEGGQLLAERHSVSFEVCPRNPSHPELLIEIAGVSVTSEQRKHGDTRRLGCAVMRVTWRDSSGEHELDLKQRCVVSPSQVTLSRDRFALPFNRSVVRFADSFIVHSRYVADRIRAERNAHTPLGILPHGSEIRWSDENRAAMRRDLGLADEWIDSFLIVSFGGVQAHKRIDKVLQGLALARKERPDIRLILAGSMHAEGFDPVAVAKSMGLEDAVRFTGYLSEADAWKWLHAGDGSINLRGPTTGGTSGGIFQAFSIGRFVIASDAAEQKELPESCVVRVPIGDGEVETLARELVDLRDDPARRARLESNVREFVQTECHWGVVARQYAEFMHSFPRARASRRRLIALRAGLQRSAL